MLIASPFNWMYLTMFAVCSGFIGASFTTSCTLRMVVMSYMVASVISMVIIGIATSSKACDITEFKNIVVAAFSGAAILALLNNVARVAFLTSLLPVLAVGFIILLVALQAQLYKNRDTFECCNRRFNLVVDAVFLHAWLMFLYLFSLVLLGCTPQGDSSP